MGGVAKGYINLDVTNIFAGSHIEHCWRCLKFHERGKKIKFQVHFILEQVQTNKLNQILFCPTFNMVANI
jgi:hypothetical protein